MVIDKEKKKIQNSIKKKNQQSIWPGQKCLIFLLLKEDKHLNEMLFQLLEN